MGRAKIQTSVVAERGHIEVSMTHQDHIVNTALCELRQTQVSCPLEAFQAFLIT